MIIQGKEEMKSKSNIEESYYTYTTMTLIGQHGGGLKTCRLQTDDLSRVHPTSHPVSAEIYSSRG